MAAWVTTSTCTAIVRAVATPGPKPAWTQARRVMDSVKERGIIEWVHPEPDERGSDFCRRMGWGPGDVLLYSSTADGNGVPDNPQRYTVVRLDVNDLDGVYNVEMECGDDSSGRYTCRHNMVVGGLRTGPLASDPVKCWPWAKA